jgi:CRP-like cAMP-binding protein
MKKAGQYRSVPEDELAKLAVFGRDRFVPKGQCIFVEKANSESIVLVVRGEVQGLLHESHSPKPVAFHTFTSGAVVGEAEAIGNVPYSYSLVTSTDCKLLYIHKFTYLSNIPDGVIKAVQMLSPLLLSTRASELRDGYIRLAATGFQYGKAPGMGKFRENALKEQVREN